LSSKIPTARFEEWDGRGDLVALIHSLNFHRRHLSVSQKAKISVGYKHELQQTMKPGNPTGANQFTASEEGNCANTCTIPDTSIPDRSPAARDRAAAMVGISHAVVDIAESICKKAPDLFARIGDSPAPGKEYTVWDAQREVKRRERQAKEAAAIAAAPALAGRSSGSLL